MLRNIVLMSDTSELPRCKAIQTFAVLEEYQQASREQLAKSIPDKFKPYFFSKKWHNEGYPAGDISFDYPLLAVMPSGMTVNGISGGPNCDTQLSLDIAVLDYYSEVDYQKYINSCIGSVMPFNGALPINNNCGSYDCSQRNVFEIFKDTNYLLRELLYDITKIGVYDNPADNQKYFLTEEYYNTHSDEYAFNRASTLMNTTRLKQGLKTVRIEQWSGGIAGLHGNLINGLTFTL